MQKELQEGVKELLRTALMAVIPLLIFQIQNGEINYQAVGVALTIAALSGIDKWLHKLDTGVRGNGLTGF